MLHFLPPSVLLLLLPSPLHSSLPHDICVTFWIPSSHSPHSLANDFCAGAAIRQNNGAIGKEICQVAKSSVKRAVEKEIFLYLYRWLTKPNGRTYACIYHFKEVTMLAESVNLRRKPRAWRNELCCKAQELTCIISGKHGWELMDMYSIDTGIFFTE